ncbi:MAG: hypothetical protein V4565_10585 [Bacteroidota bacterium]
MSFGLIKGGTGRALEGEWYDYGYGLLTLCSIFGNKLSRDGSEFVYNDSWWQINTILRTNGCTLDLSRMTESQQIFDTPFEVSYIYTNLYNKKEVVEIAKHLIEVEKRIHSENHGLYDVLKKD